MSPHGNFQELIEQIQTLVAADKLERAIEELRAALPEKDAALDHELVQHQASLARSRTDQRRALLSWEEMERIRTRVRYAVLDILAGLPCADVAARARDTRPASHPEGTPPIAQRIPSVFISYSANDRLVVHELASELRAQGIAVCIDTDDVETGEDLAAFIHRSVRDTDATLLVVSRTSLLSAWVAMEATSTLEHEKWAGAKKLIACYLDAAFLEPGFRLEATRMIDARLAEITNLIPRYVDQHIDTNDLNQDKSRLFNLRNNLGTILQRLRISLCLDIREPHFARSVELIVTTLKGR